MITKNLFHCWQNLLPGSRIFILDGTWRSSEYTLEEPSRSDLPTFHSPLEPFSHPRLIAEDGPSTPSGFKDSELSDRPESESLTNLLIKSTEKTRNPLHQERKITPPPIPGKLKKEKKTNKQYIWIYVCRENQKNKSKTQNKWAPVPEDSRRGKGAAICNKATERKSPHELLKRTKEHVCMHVCLYVGRPIQKKKKKSKSKKKINSGSPKIQGLGAREPGGAAALFNNNNKKAASHREKITSRISFSLPPWYDGSSRGLWNRETCFDFRNFLPLFLMLMMMMMQHATPSSPPPRRHPSFFQNHF